MKSYLVASPIVASIFGGVLALVAIPIFLFQAIAFLQGKDAGILPEAQAASLATAAVLVFFSLVILTWRHRVTADPATQTITWTRHTLGLSWTSAKWKRDNILSIDFGHAGYGHTTWYVLARTEKRRKVIFERTAIGEPTTVAQAIASIMRRRVVNLGRLPRGWWKGQTATTSE